MIKKEDLIVDKYIIPNHTHFTSIYIQRIWNRGNSKWVIRIESESLGKDLVWRDEPLPSNRTEEFIELTRFDTLDEALEIYNQWAATQVTNHD